MHFKVKRIQFNLVIGYIKVYFVLLEMHLNSVLVTDNDKEVFISKCCFNRIIFCMSIIPNLFPVPQRMAASNCL